MEKKTNHRRYPNEYDSDDTLRPPPLNQLQLQQHWQQQEQQQQQHQQQVIQLHQQIRQQQQQKEPTSTSGELTETELDDIVNFALDAPQGYEALPPCSAKGTAASARNWHSNWRCVVSPVPRPIHGSLSIKVEVLEDAIYEFVGRTDGRQKIYISIFSLLRRLITP